ncbi:PREDICTED: basic blue protein-like [Nelumbo nucifera]|uniref:Plantacyanin n=2 Tax=Nelumbo nucifera TaxID=4432 RepID=A0A822ZA26_NELNU|nr:PREDICTED: basic blue protein-like [Nelumbo nucifera]DAD39886.1 TPA_asm: hypothetical protein HUJ06_014209 [Nelumbo nucifera]
MARGRGNASAVVILGLTLLCLLVHCEMVHAATFMVGDAGGWTFNTAAWPNGKSFRAGDVLVFRYSPAIHNVVAVDRNGYNSCTTPRGARVLTTGNDQIKLARGQNYFICTIAGHCQAGMKIAVTAA